MPEKHGKTPNPVVEVRPTDLAREHGISTQAVRNYEKAGFIPQAGRTAAGYRRYTEVHAAALRTYLALVAAYGHATGGRIMTAVNRGRLDQALETVDLGHELLLRDRSTLRKVEAALAHLEFAAETDGNSEPLPGARSVFSVGELSRRLGVTSATLRNWERAGILTPRRHPTTGQRSYHANDVRDAEMAHLLRRGGYLLRDIAAITEQIRAGGGTRALGDALQSWNDRITARGMAMLGAASHLARYIETAQMSAGLSHDLLPDQPLSTSVTQRHDGR